MCSLLEGLWWLNAFEPTSPIISQALFLMVDCSSDKQLMRVLSTCIGIQVSSKRSDSWVPASTSWQAMRLVPLWTDWRYSKHAVWTHASLQKSKPFTHSYWKHTALCACKHVKTPSPDSLVRALIWLTAGSPRWLSPIISWFEAFLIFLSWFRNCEERMLCSTSVSPFSHIDSIAWKYKRFKKCVLQIDASWQPLFPRCQYMHSATYTRIWKQCWHVFAVIFSSSTCAQNVDKGDSGHAASEDA